MPFTFKTPQTVNGSDHITSTALLKQAFTENGVLLKPGKITYDKKVAIIYNPNSGKKQDIRQPLITALKSKQIEFEFHETEGFMHAWRLASTIPLQECSALIAVGGDGTLHEVVNGLQFREDKFKVPIAFIPNGSGNDTCKSIGVTSIDQALSYILKGDTVKLDLNRIYIDADSFEEIEKWEEPQKFQKIRYSLINASMGFIAKVVHRAHESKSWAGSQSYVVGGLKTFFSGEPQDTYYLETYHQEKLVYQRKATSLCFMIMNGKFGGGGFPFTPYALMNDGLLDLTFLDRPDIRSYQVPGLLHQVLMQGGIHSYDEEWQHIRGDKLVIQNLNTDLEGNNKKVQMFQVDGEGLTFIEKITIDVAKEALDLIVDYNQLL